VFAMLKSRFCKPSAGSREKSSIKQQKDLIDIAFSSKNNYM
jgi:hypothetical protein